MKEKIIKLGQKLLALSREGVGGEAENAKAMLDAYMLKHGLTMDMIEPNQRKNRLIEFVNNDNVQMLANLVASIVGSDYTLYKCKGKNYRRTDMTDLEWMEFQRKWEVLRKELKREMLKKKREIQKQLKMVSTAFIHKHNLFSKDRPESNEPVSLPTPEEMEEIMEMLRMKSKMKDINFYKEIGN